jgi:hypothetical protein
LDSGSGGSYVDLAPSAKAILATSCDAVSLLECVPQCTTLYAYLLERPRFHSGLTLFNTQDAIRPLAYGVPLGGPIGRRERIESGSGTLDDYRTNGSIPSQGHLPEDWN